jgi:hypothetical protein
MKRPTGSDYKSVKNFIYNEKPLVNAEQSWVLWQEDLVTLRPGRENAWLDAAIEHLLRLLHCDLVEYLFCSAVSFA